LPKLNNSILLQLGEHLFNFGAGKKMKPQEGKNEQSFSLRQQAELALQGKLVNLQSWTLENIQNLIDELQIHQVELQLQNEQLHQTQRELEATRDKFAYLYNFAPVSYITIDEQGRIWEANLTAVAKLGLEKINLPHYPLYNCIVPEDQDTYYLWRRSLFKEREARSCELRLVGENSSPFYAKLEGIVAQDPETGASLARVVITDIMVLKETESVLRALTTRLGEVQELERQQLARELHDEIGQNLTALGFNLNFMEAQLANPNPKIPLLQERLSDSLNLVEQTADRIRDVMSELRPPMLDDYGLVDALEWYGHRFAKRMQLKVEVEGDSNLPRLEAAVENALFRITQEAFNNVAKHAQATLVTLSIFEIGNKIRLVILDDGLGFEPARRSRTSIPPGLGLLTMKERAEAVGGSCWIESQPGRGTRVIVEVSP
jgi:signal transduction histidine kinase